MHYNAFVVLLYIITVLKQKRKTKKMRSRLCRMPLSVRASPASVLIGLTALHANSLTRRYCMIDWSTFCVSIHNH